MLEKRFGALRTIGSIFKVLGIISVIAGAVMAIIAIVFLSVRGVAGPMSGLRMMTGSGVWAGLTALFWGALGGLVLYGAGEVIYLLIAVEENTRAATLMLRQQMDAPAKPGLPPDSGDGQ